MLIHTHWIRVKRTVRGRVVKFVGRCSRHDMVLREKHIEICNWNDVISALKSWSVSEGGMAEVYQKKSSVLNYLAIVHTIWLATCVHCIKWCFLYLPWPFEMFRLVILWLFWDLQNQLYHIEVIYRIMQLWWEEYVIARVGSLKFTECMLLYANMGIVDIPLLCFNAHARGSLDWGMWVGWHSETYHTAGCFQILLADY